MRIKFLGEFEKYGEFDFKCNSLKSMFSGIKFKLGTSVVNFMLSNEFIYCLTDSTEKNIPVFLTAEVNATDFTGYDTVTIIPVLNGADPFSLTALIGGATAAAGAAGGVTTVAFMGATMFTVQSSLVGLALASVGNLAIGLAAYGIMNALSPTPHFSNDPARSKERPSNLFGIAPTTVEKGGVVPLIMGRPYCSGVLISSGISSAQTSAPAIITQ